MAKVEMDEVREMLKEYAHWLSDKTMLADAGSEWIEITSPTLDRHNDYLQIYMRQEDGYYLLTDDGYVISDLAVSGCLLNTPRRKELLDVTLAGFGIQVEDDCLVAKATRENFPVKKHNMLQAMLAVNDMFYLSSPHTASLFYDNVVEWFEASDIRYTPRVKFTGKSGYDNMFDFVIPKSKRSPERLIQLANTPDKNKIQSLMFQWVDTRETRGIDVAAYMLFNDEDSPPPRPTTDAISRYDAIPVMWSERDKFRDELAA
jgi:hypothetical protein